MLCQWRYHCHTTMLAESTLYIAASSMLVEPLSHNTPVKSLRCPMFSIFFLHLCVTSPSPVLVDCYPKVFKCWCLWKPNITYLFTLNLVVLLAGTRCSVFFYSVWYHSYQMPFSHFKSFLYGFYVAVTQNFFYSNVENDKTYKGLKAEPTSILPYCLQLLWLPLSCTHCIYLE